VSDSSADRSGPVEVARGLLQAYLDQDRRRAEDLLADDMTFTSPQDDYIDRRAYFERCFPTVDRVRWQTLLNAAPLGPDEAVIVYEYELTSGQRHRNVEVITVRDGRATEIQVFFGGQVR
jgi:ketosteroid isomerase-like protein